jgi:2-phosphoglycerate kinase
MYDALLIGGASGTGKSALAAGVARLTGAQSVIATDVIRQVLRGALRDQTASPIHAERFNVPLPSGELPDTVNLQGFLDQARMVMDGVAGALEHARKERWFTVVEGVHAVPGLAVGGFTTAQVLVVTCDESAHRRNLASRDESSGGGRPAAHYFANFERVRAVQDFLIERAEAAAVPIVDTSHGTLDDALQRLLESSITPWEN